jgi:hypothetical protein
MFVFDPLSQGLELLAQRDLQRAEALFLRVINDPYVQSEELKQARTYLDDIRSCQSGNKELDFDQYKRLTRNNSVALDPIYDILQQIYFSPCKAYTEFDEEISRRIPLVINKIKQIKIRDILARDALFKKIEKQGMSAIKKNQAGYGNNYHDSDFDLDRWKTLFRKFTQAIHPILLERHLELLEYILSTGEIGILEDSKLTALTPKYRWIVESTLKSKWYLLRSYFFKARSEIQNQFNKKEGTRKYWEEVKYKKIRIFEQCGFQEKQIQKFLYIDKLNYKTLEEIHEFSREFGLTLVPRDVSLALRGVEKAKDHIRERGGQLMGNRKVFQDRLIALGFSRENSYKIARQAKKSSNGRIAEAFEQCLQIARDEIHHLFDRGRLNKFLLQAGKPLIRKQLIQCYGEKVVDLHCYFRLETIHQFYKLKYFQYHSQTIPSVSELIKISRREFQPLLVQGYESFIKKRRLTLPAELYQALKEYRSRTSWEDAYTTPEEKFLLRCWFLMDHGVSITQGLVNKGVLNPKTDLSGYMNSQELVCAI